MIEFSIKKIFYEIGDGVCKASVLASPTGNPQEGCDTWGYELIIDDALQMSMLEFQNTIHPKVTEYFEKKLSSYPDSYRLHLVHPLLWR